MKKRSILFLTKMAILLLAICSVSMCFISCGQNEGQDPKKQGPNYEEMLQGTWIWKEYESNPIYRYLEFSEKKVKYGTNLFGSDLESATWVCSYKINDGKLILTTDDGTNFTFTLEGNETKIRIYDEDRHEYEKK